MVQSTVLIGYETYTVQSKLFTLKKNAYFVVFALFWFKKKHLKIMVNIQEKWLHKKN